VKEEDSNRRRLDLPLEANILAALQSEFFALFVLILGGGESPDVVESKKDEDTLKEDYLPRVGRRGEGNQSYS